MKNKAVNSESGSTLVTVTVVMTMIAISLAIFLKSQTSTLGSFANRRDKLQAIANARAAIHKGFIEIETEDEEDTSAINESLWEEEDSSSLWVSEKFGNAEIEFSTTPFAQEVTATGTFENQEYNTKAERRSTFTPDDTVLIVCNESVLTASNCSGSKAIFDSDSVAGALPLNIRGAALAKEWLAEQFADDDLVLDAPLTVSSAKGFNNLEDTLRGPLFLASVSSTLELNGNDRTIVVQGDLQLTGEIKVRNTTFVGNGEVRVNDFSTMTNCNIYCKDKLFLGDESKFSGRIASLERIEIFQLAEVLDESLIISFAGKKKPKSKTKATAGENSKAKSGSSDKVTGKMLNKSAANTKSAVGAINLREQVKVSATCVALGNAGIMTEMDSKSSGLMWSKTWIRHRGKHVGTLRAPLFKGEPGTDAPKELPATGVSKGKKQPIQQVVIGSIERPFEKVVYPLPWFLGDPKLISWREWN